VKARLEILGSATLLCTCFGTGIIAIRVGVSHFAPLTFTMVRLAVILLAFVVLLAVTGRRMPRDRRFLGLIVLVGLLNVGFPYTLSALTLRLVSSTLYSILMNLIPVLSVVLAHFFLPDERMTARKALGVTAAVSGASVVVWAGAGADGAAESAGALAVGTAMIVANALSVAVCNILLRKRMRNEDRLLVTGGQMTVGLGLVAPAALLAEGVPDLGAVAWQGWAALLWAALIGAFLGYWMSFSIIRRWGVTTSAVASTGVPLVTGIVAVLMLGETLSAAMVVGGLVLVAGVLVVLLGERAGAR
jgi:drug/metabolite transporter (DMT)-like permease